MGFPYTFPIQLSWLNRLLNDQPRPPVDFSYPKSAAEIEIPKSNTNKIQSMGSSGREMTFSGEVWTDSDVSNLLSLIQTTTTPTVFIPELQEQMKVIPVDLSITEEAGQVNRHHYELTLKETS